MCPTAGLMASGCAATSRWGKAGRGSALHCCDLQMRFAMRGRGGGGGRGLGSRYRTATAFALYLNCRCPLCMLLSVQQCRANAEVFNKGSQPSPACSHSPMASNQPCFIALNCC